MGKNEEQGLYQSEPIDLEAGNPGPCRSVCPGTWMVLSKISIQFSFRCVFFLILGLSVLLPGIFWILPPRSVNYSFDAKAAIKSRATVQASFKLQKAVSDLVQQIGRLEYDISGELSIPDAKVAVLSMHQNVSSNLTDLVFGVIADPINMTITPLSLGLLRSSLIELYLEETNLRLTTIFGQPSKFEILKFPGGLTVIPTQSVPIGWLPQILFNFTLNNSISDIEDNFSELRDQLEYGLHLGSHENVFMQVTNRNGSTVFPPVVVQASILTDEGGLLPQRLKQLAQIISDSPMRNLGLNNSIFGKVKSISLSSYFNGSLHEYPPTASPAPSPEPSSAPYLTAPPNAQAPSPLGKVHPPCFNCKAGSPQSGHSNPSASPHKSITHRSFLPALHSPSPSPVISHTTDPCPYSRQAVPPSMSPEPHSNQVPNAPAKSPHPQLPLHLSPLPAVSYGSGPSHDMGSTKSSVSPVFAPSLSAESQTSLSKEILSKERWFTGIFGLSMLHLLLWSW